MTLEPRPALELLTPGDPVTLELQDGSKVEGQASWIGNDGDEPRDCWFGFVGPDGMEILNGSIKSVLIDI
jgi:hypothetical protein